MIQQTASLQSSVVNLLKTIIGAGLLAIPLSFRADGIVLGLFIVLLAGITSGFGLYLQALSSKFVKNGDANFFNICSITYPSLSLVFDIAIAVQCFGVGLSYIVLIGDLAPTVFTVNVANERLFWILISAVVIVPLTFLKKLDSLKYTSLIALSAIVYMSVLVYAHFFMELKHELIDHHKSDFKGEVSIFNPESWSSVLSTFSIVVFAYTGHQNMYSIINELKINSIFEIIKIAYISIPMTAVLFVTIGLSGYFTFGNNVGGNIIMLYEDSIFTKIGRFSIVLMVLLSYPLMFYPCRISINNIVFWIQQRFSQNADTDDENDQLLVVTQQPIRPVLSDRRFYLLTIGLLSLSYFLAISLSSFELILSIVGATGSTAISFILPGLFGYKLVASKESEDILKILDTNNQFEEEQNFEKIEKLFNSKALKKFSLALTLWGIIVMVLCLYSSLFLE